MHVCTHVLDITVVDGLLPSISSISVLSHVISFLKEDNLRLVLDTDVLVASLRNDRGASRQLIVGALDGKFELLASVPLIVEYEAVLTRPEPLEASGLTSREVNEVLDALVKVSIPVHLWFLWRPRLKDPADEMVLETAVNGAADRLATFNLRHLAEAAREFGIDAARPSDIWKEIRRHEKK